MYTGAVGVYSKFVHYIMERQYANKTFPNVLEVGAGHGQHQPFVRHAYSANVVMMSAGFILVGMQLTGYFVSP
jgi:hypothetical protein